MENAHQNGSAEFKIIDGQKTDFNQIFGNVNYVVTKALELFKKDPTNFILAFAIPVVVGGILSAILVPMLFGGMILTGGMVGGLVSLAVYIFCSIVLSVVAYVALIKAVVDVSKGNKLDLVGLFKFGFTHCVNFVILGVKMFLTIFTGLRNFVNSWMASIYFVENGGNVDQSIKSSQATATGKTATLVWTLILVSLAASIISSILGQIWVNIFWRMSWDLAALGVYIINGVVTPFAIISQFVLRAELEKHSAAHHAPVHHQA